MQRRQAVRPQAAPGLGKRHPRRQFRRVLGRRLSRLPIVPQESRARGYNVMTASNKISFVAGKRRIKNLSLACRCGMSLWRAMQEADF